MPLRVKKTESRYSWWIRPQGEGTQQRLGVMKEEAKLGGAKLRHEEIGIVSRDKLLLKTDEVGFRTVYENMGGSETVMTVGA